MANEDLINKENLDTNIDLDNSIEIEGLERDSYPEEEKEEILYNDDGTFDKEEQNEDQNEELVEEDVAQNISQELEENSIESDTEKTETEAETPLKEEQSNHKEKKYIKYILAILALLIFSIITFIILSGEDKEEMPMPKQEMVKELPPVQTYKFKLDHINIQRLNDKLEFLTKYELLGISEEEYERQEKIKELKRKQEEEDKKRAIEEKKLAEEKKAEEEKLAQQKKLEEEKLAQQKKAEKEELAALEKSQETVNDNILQTNNEDKTSKIQNDIFLKFIQINTNKKAIYKDYLKEIKKIDSRVNPCRDIDNTIQVFVGPLNKEDNVDTLINSFKQNKISDDVVFVEVTKEEFSTRCNIFEN